VHERVGIAVTETELLHREAAQFAVLREAAAGQQRAQLVQCPAGLRLDVLQLRIPGLVE